MFSVETGFDWNALRAACDSLSLFSERRLLELRLPGGKPGKEGSAALRDYAERPAEDTVLLIVSGKLEAAARNSKWVQALDKAGVGVTVWPVEAAQLPAWIERRMRARGMQAEADALTLLAERPRIRDRVGAMRESVCRACGIEPGRVGIKATTLEGLGARDQRHRGKRKPTCPVA